MKDMFLIGHHIAHSLSPAMWNHLFERTERPTRYGRRDVDVMGLPGVLAELRSGAVMAANVTMPHKGWAADVCDNLSEPATRTQAVNLMLPLPGGRLLGSNTDVTGARSILALRGPFDSAVVFGAGGTATALLEALTGHARRVVITNRSSERADALALRYSGRFDDIRVMAWEERAAWVPGAELIVNTAPFIDESPIDVARLDITTVIYDVVYRREPTALQRQALHRGIALTDGLTHLAAQAIAMLEPLGIEESAAQLLVEGLELATGRTVTAWGRPLG